MWHAIIIEFMVLQLEERNTFLFLFSSEMFGQHVCDFM